MSVQPLITFKAGLCEGPGSGTDGNKVVCLPTPGFVYLYRSSEDELTHLCYTPRANTTSDPELDLIMFPGDGSFTPYLDAKSTGDELFSPTNGRIFRLKFSSSSARYYFWLQSKPQHSKGPAYFSDRDLTLGTVVNEILSTDEDVDVQGILGTAGSGPGDDDEDMGDAPPDNNLSRESTGGAGPDATGGDFREEGEEAREGGADGARAPPSNLDASSAVQNFLRSLQGGSSAQQHSQQGGAFTTLPDLLTPEACIATLNNAKPAYLNSLLSYLPPQLLTLAQRADDIADMDSMEASSSEAAIEALSMEQKKDLLTRVFRSPQLYQSLGSLTMALRDGGLPMVSDALKIKVENNGFIRGGTMPLGEGKAVEAFLEGVKKTVEEENGKEAEGPSSTMDTS